MGKTTVWDILVEYGDSMNLQHLFTSHSVLSEAFSPVFIVLLNQIT